jgi:uncharacterized OB-fold protein
MSELPRLGLEPSPELAGFWEATNRGVLLLARCDACAKVIWYPRPFCSTCGSTEVSWFESSGRGAVYTYTVVRKSSPPFDAVTPYVVAFVELDEGPRFLTNIVGCDPETVRIGQRVMVEFDPPNDYGALYRFRPESAEEVTA